MSAIPSKQESGIFIFSLQLQYLLIETNFNMYFQTGSAVNPIFLVFQFIKL